ncbi:DNA cytosine methyltransferase [Haloplanus rubicundus]|uniref:DNA (cytosine-5-)-methyltransferase n=1 Tax=Haloplanus rubicundus TaxID=1547898 RepID=A0A345E2Z1_9EURY|nr:DNA cytosine methyltransferase [Haloplanus rubicundus]AXG06563.1 DNA cytosine methyltransferase [Haloplanus rubicundus]
MTSRLTCVDLFCGAGGFSLGFSHAGFDVVAATDYQESAGKTYTHNLDAPFLQADVADLAREIEPLVTLGNFDAGAIDVVVGGPPCKGFSTAGVYNPDDPRSSLLHHYIRAVEHLQPRAIVVENVPGAKAVRDGTYVDALLRNARDLGYKIRMMKLNAADYGVPQLRERLFFVGYKDDIPVSRPIPTHAGDAKQQRLGETLIDKKHVTVAEAISDLSFLGPGEESHEYELPPQSEYQEQMRDGHEGPLFNHVAPNHSDIVRERFQTLDEGAGIDDLPPRLQTDKHSMRKYDRTEPANTVTTLPEDFVHYEQPRIPTVRELARLQSFPDWFEFKGPRTTGGPQRIDSLPQYSQVGNAVPPLMAEAVGWHVKATLTGGDPREAARARLRRLGMST